MPCACHGYQGFYEALPRGAVPPVERPMNPLDMYRVRQSLETSRRRGRKLEMLLQGKEDTETDCC